MYNWIAEISKLQKKEIQRERERERGTDLAFISECLFLLNMAPLIEKTVTVNENQYIFTIIFNLFKKAVER
jgi:hypothetical protein